MAGATGAKDTSNESAERHTFASFLCGKTHIVDDKTLHLPLPPMSDALFTALTNPGSKIVLGLDFSNRRRNRLSTEVMGTTSTHSIVRVIQAFGNCPQYINTIAGHTSRVSSEQPDKRSKTRGTYKLTDV